MSGCQKGVAHALWAGAEAGNVATRLKDRVSYLGTVEGFQTIACGISK